MSKEMRAALDTLAALHAMDFEVHAARFHSGRDCGPVCPVHDPRGGRWLAMMQRATDPALASRGW